MRLSEALVFIIYSAKSSSELPVKRFGSIWRVYFSDRALILLQKEFMVLTTPDSFSVLQNSSTSGILSLNGWTRVIPFTGLSTVTFSLMDPLYPTSIKSQADVTSSFFLHT